MKATLGMILVLLCVCAPAQTGVGRRAVASSAFQQLAEVTGAQAGADFAGSIAISGTTIVVGAPLGTSGCSGQSNCGVAYVYTQTNGSWSDLTLVATLTESNGMPDGGFGQSVSISGNTIVVAGYDATIKVGAAYVFVEPSGGWQNMTQTAELNISGAPPFDSIYGVAIDGDTVVVGTPFASAGHNQNQGTASVYVMPLGGWTNMTQTAQLFATDAAPNFEFGVSVGVSGRNIVVGAPEATVGGVTKRGAAYLFVEPATGWGGIRKQTTELDPSDGSREASFGGSVSVSGSAIAVGAPGQTVNSSQSEGAAYVFARPSNGWPHTMTETAELTAGKGGPGEKLGFSVSISSGSVIAGAPLARSGQGIAYLFLKPAGGWRNISSTNEISATDGTANNYFGWSAGTGQGAVMAGAYGWPAGGPGADGAVYVFGAAQ